MVQAASNVAVDAKRCICFALSIICCDSGDRS
jgi:hypothetical protein